MASLSFLPTLSLSRALVLGLVLATDAQAREPRITSWLTEGSGRYARLFQTVADEAAGNAVTTWSRGQGTQALPVYAGVHEISHSDDWVYVRTTGLGAHVMGPWYLNAAKTNLFPNYPANRAVLYRIPRAPAVPVTRTLTGLGVIGYFVDGVAMFDSRDAFSYSNANGADAAPGTAFAGDGVWNRDAWVNEGVTFDAANAHQAGPTYHYHANPPALRHRLGDHVTYHAATNRYTEDPAAPRHSPILGWVRDGFPVYGPYGYSDPNDAGSGVRRMISGYQKRDGSNGSANLAATGRATLPAWAALAQNRSAALPANLHGPAVSAQHVLGHYLEDYEFKGDLGMTQGVHFDLDVCNGRYCVTPDFPGGTYAYFVCIEADGTPVYPYNIGRWFFGSPAGNNVGAITETVTRHFEGGPEKPDTAGAGAVAVEAGTGNVTVTWSGVEGAKYEVDYSPDLAVWKTMTGTLTAASDAPAILDPGIALSAERQFYRARRVGLQPFDTAGFDFTPAAFPQLVTITVDLSGASPAPADLGVDPASLSFNGQPVLLVNRPSRQQIRIRLDVGSLAPGSYPVSVTFAGVDGPLTGTVVIGGGPATGGNNILLLILDDWGVDMSPMDNTTPGVALPQLPTLQSLAEGGIRFTQAYAMPLCSPTRAAIMTGRLPFRNGVGNPQANSTLAASELALPEVFTAQSSPYALASFGKWHLGGGTTGPFTRGGWPWFKGILTGAVSNYFLWDKVEVINGAATTITGHTTYTTTDQVNEAVSWITSQGARPWLCWMAFNAPHDPFHEPPAELAPPGGYTAGGGNRGMYLRALEALDTEIGRLLAAVDLAKTNILVIGDNGTPAQVVQAPFGNGNAKGDLYQGGVRVPFFAKGPDITAPAGTTSDKLVSVVDLFSTVLELGGIDSAAATSAVDVIDSKSLLPLLRGATDLADRCAVVEKFGINAMDGRALVSDDYPDYKLVIFGDRLSTTDTPAFEFYHITNDMNEQSPLNIPALSGAALDAYDHLVAKDAALGGGYSDPAAAVQDTLYLQLANTTGPASPPQNLAVNPTAVTVNGLPATYVGRLNATDAADRYWVKVTLPQAPPYTTAVVTFPNNPNTGDPRVFSAIQIIVAP